MAVKLWTRWHNRREALPGATQEAELVVVVAACGGDRDAFDQLAARYSEPLQRFLARRVARDLVEDTLQETLLGAWASLPGFEPRVQFKTWLYRIALNKAADTNRFHIRRGTHETPLSPHSEQFISGDWWLDTERRETAQNLLGQLTPPQREILELYYYSELTLAEIAQASGRKLSAVKHHFYAAHARAAAACASEIYHGEAACRRPGVTPQEIPTKS